MDYIAVGKIINTHGIKGDLKIYPITEDINRFDDLETAYLGKDKTKVKIDKVRYHKDLVIIKLKEFDNINEVLKYKDEFIYIDEKDKIQLPEDHFFIFDIEDCLVFDTDNKEIGIVTKVIQSAGNDIYVIKDPKINKEYLIPAVKEFIVDIDIQNKRIVIDPIEGMIE